MTKNEVANMLNQLSSGSITSSDLVISSNVLNIVESILLGAISSKDEDILNKCLYYFFMTNSFSSNSCDIMCDLINEEWHQEHEDLIAAIQFNVHCPGCILKIESALKIKHEYLIDRDGYIPYVRNCLHTIKSYKNDKSDAAMQRLKKDEDVNIRIVALEF